MAFNQVDHFINNYAIAIAGLLEVILLTWFFRVEGVRQYANNLSDFGVGRWWNASLTIVTPILLGIMFVYNTFIDFTVPYGKYDKKSLIIMGGGTVIITFLAAYIVKGLKGSREYERSISKGVDMG